MAHAGDTIENPVDGQRIMFVRTVEDSGGDELAIELFTPPGTSAVPAHLHLAAEETYEVLAGTLGVWVGSKRQLRTVGPGGRVALPPRVAHQHWNAGPDLLHVVNTFRPAGNLELGLQATFGLARDEKVLKGCSYGSARPRVDMIRLLDLYRQRRLKLDELITRTYSLDEINEGFELLQSGAVARGVVVMQ